MCWKGATGYMGYTSNEHPLVIKLIDQFNEIMQSCDRWKNDEEKPMPEHLVKLNDAINSTREFLAKNPPLKKTLIETIITETKSF